MKNLKLILFTLSVFALSCNDSNEIDYPMDVTFTYNGAEVTYQVIKQDYTRDHHGDTLETPITKLWLDRNLGAVRPAEFFNDPMARGDLFQWGRSDDGHQLRNSDTTHVLSGSIVPGHNKYIASPLGPDDWLITPDNSLWNGVANTNCPCPEGWRVPTVEELQLELHSWTSPDMNGAYESLLKWVATGNRDNHGTLRYEDIWAFMWSSSPDDNGQPNELAIIATDAAEIISAPRIYAAAVRCIKDYE